MRHRTTGLLGVAIAIIGALVWVALLVQSKPDPQPKRSADRADQARAHPGLAADPGTWHRAVKPIDGLAADAQGRVHLAAAPDGSPHSIITYSTEGKRLWERRPFGLSLYSWPNIKINQRDQRLYAFGSRERGGPPGPSDSLIEIDSALAIFGPEDQGKLALTQEGMPDGGRFALDAAGRAYIETVVSRGGSQFWVISAYGSNGERAWTIESPKDRPGHVNGTHGMAVDDEGHVYRLARWDEGEGSEWSSVSALLQVEDGHERWTVNPGRRGDFPREIIAADDGVYLIGSWPGVIRVVKYDREGRVLWTKDLPAGSATAQASQTRRGAVLAQGHLHLLYSIFEGEPNNPDSQSNHLLSVKLDRTGNVQWEKRFLKVSDGWLEPIDPAVDFEGNIFTAVRYSRSSEGDPESVRLHDRVFVIKQGPDGKILSKLRLAPKISFKGWPVIFLAPNPKGGLYVGGTYVAAMRANDSIPDLKGFLIKYNR